MGVEGKGMSKPGPGGEDHWRAGNHYFLAGLYPEATLAYTLAAESDPHNPAIFHNRALARAALADSDGALEDSWRALEISPEFPPSVALSAALHQARGSKSRAQRLRRRSASREETTAPALRERIIGAGPDETLTAPEVDDLAARDRVLTGAVPDLATLHELLVENPEI